VTELASSYGERRAWHSTCEEINVRELGSAYVPYISLEDSPIGPVEQQRRAGVRIDFDRRDMLEAGLFQP
jgi:hypothetical protein